MSALVGWFVGWPNTRDEYGDLEDCCGYGEIVAVAGDYILVRVIDGETFDDEPEYHATRCLSDKDLRFFKTAAEYLAWIEYWRREDTKDDKLRYSVPKGSA